MRGRVGSCPSTHPHSPPSFPLHPSPTHPPHTGCTRSSSAWPSPQAGPTPPKPPPSNSCAGARAGHGRAGGRVGPGCRPHGRPGAPCRLLTPVPGTHAACRRLLLGLSRSVKKVALRLIETMVDKCEDVDMVAAQVGLRAGRAGAHACVCVCGGGRRPLPGRGSAAGGGAYRDAPRHAAPAGAPPLPCCALLLLCSTCPR